MSWTFGLFSGLVVVLILGAFLKESDVDSEWEANATMIIEESTEAPQYDDVESATETTGVSEEETVLPELEDETLEGTEPTEDGLTIGGEPIKQSDQTGGQ